MRIFLPDLLSPPSAVEPRVPFFQLPPLHSLRLHFVVPSKLFPLGDGSGMTATPARAGTLSAVSVAFPPPRVEVLVPLFLSDIFFFSICPSETPQGGTWKVNVFSLCFCVLFSFTFI